MPVIVKAMILDSVSRHNYMKFRAIFTSIYNLVNSRNMKHINLLTL